MVYFIKGIADFSISECPLIDKNTIIEPITEKRDIFTGPNSQNPLKDFTGNLLPPKYTRQGKKLDFHAGFLKGLLL